MTTRLAVVFSTIFLSLSWLAAAWAAPCGSLLEQERRFDAVVTTASGRLLSRGPFTIIDIRNTGSETVFKATYTPDDAAHRQLSGLSRDGEVSMLVDGSALPEASGNPAWLGVCSETGITGRIGGDRGFELLPAAESEVEASAEEEHNATDAYAVEGEDDWPAASEAPILIPEPEDVVPPEANASGLEAVEDLPELPRDDAEASEAEDPVAQALRELSADTDATGTAQVEQGGDGESVGNETTQAEGADLTDSSSGAAIDMSSADCRYLPRYVFSDEFPNMRLSPIHSTAATIPGTGRVCFLTLHAGDGGAGDVDFAFYAGVEPLAIMRGPGIPVSVRGLSLRDLSGDGAPEVIAVMQRADGGYENRIYWSQKKDGSYIWEEDPVINRHVSGETTVEGVIAIITGEKISKVSVGEAAISPEQPAVPNEPALTPEAIQPQRSTPSPRLESQDVRVGSVLDLTGRFVRTGRGLRYMAYGNSDGDVLLVDALPPDDEARLDQLTRKDTRVAAEVMGMENQDGKRVVRLQVLQVQLL